MLHRRAFNAMLAGTGLAITVTSVAHADEVEVAVDPSEAKFEPETIKIKVGDTVTWTNTQLVAHTVTSTRPRRVIPRAPFCRPGCSRSIPVKWPRTRPSSTPSP